MNIMEEKYNILFGEWMEGKISDEELKKLIPKEAYLSFLKLKKGLEVYTELEQPLDKSWKKLKTGIQPNKNTKFIKLLVPIASIAAILLLFVSVNKFFSEKIVSIQTASAQHKTYLLPDGSEVILNENSSIKFDKKQWTNKRVVELEGEAFFKVKKGSDFVVKTSNGNIQTIGTQFDVKSVKSIFDVLCFEGKIKVKLNTYKKTFVLSSGNGIRLNNKEIERIKLENQTLPDWLNLMDTFEQEPLSNVLKEIEKIYDVKFKINNIDLNRKFTGKIPHNNLEKSLQIVLKPMEIDYQIKKDSIIIFNSSK